MLTGSSQNGTQSVTCLQYAGTRTTRLPLYRQGLNHSLLFEYDQLLTKQDLADVDHPKPNLSLGWEINTGTHAFQVFAANYSNIINQHNLLYNSNDFADGEFLFGFNITVRF